MNEYLNKNTESKLIALGNKRYYRAWILTVAWILFVLVAFLLFMIKNQRSFFEIRNYILLVFCVLPFFPFSAHKILFSRSFYATVAYAVHSVQFESLKSAKVERVAVLEVTYKKDSGKEFTVVYKKNNFLMKGLHYDEGDRVFFVRGLKYPFEFPICNGKERTCPICGSTIEAEETACKRCRLDFSKLY